MFMFLPAVSRTAIDSSANNPEEQKSAINKIQITDFKAFLSAKRFEIKDLELLSSVENKYFGQSSLLN